ncbi:MAG: hypothetical protein HKN91_01115 [Acidimicrobiia bacterium]|nr:hypothetical protein [Acidimicrobiia bacterium]
MMFRRSSLPIASLTFLLIAAACGGSDTNGSGGNGVTQAPGGDNQLVLGGEIPDYFPADFYFPEGISIGGVSRSGDMISLSGTFEDGDPEAIQADVVAGLQAAGYELLSNEDIAAFVKNGVGRVRVRTSDFLGALTMTVDIDTWTDEQLDELRALFVEERVVPGRATAEVGDVRIEAEGECTLMGESRSFYAEDVSITLQINVAPTGTIVYADVTSPDGRVFTIDQGASGAFTNSDSALSASGEMTEFTSEAIERFDFSIQASCDA